MKKILQALDGAVAKPVVDSNDMKKFVSIIREGKGPLNRPTVAETLTMQHYTEQKKTITTPVLNVAEGATPSMIGKYFKAVEQELREAAEQPNIRATSLAKRVANKMNEGLRDPKDNPCWTGYKPVGTKKKAGKTVPNCVPKEAVNPAQQAAIAIAKKKAGKK